MLAVLAVIAAVIAIPAPAQADTVGTGHGSVWQAYLTGGTPGQHVSLLNADGATVGSGRVDRLGSLVVRNLPAAAGYRFVVNGKQGNAFRVLDNKPPSRSLYTGQKLHPGLNYLKVRDGVTLAAFVRLPVGKTLADGPFPTVIEYSGYQTAAPHPLIVGAATGALGIRDRLAPHNGVVLGAELAPDIGFASVSLQMRGTGCSGGAFDLFDWPTIYDGYDAVETVAAQPWVSGHKVGLVGISFSGISQLSVAGTQPPSLAAIAPMSLTDDLYSTEFPGGIENLGFASTWVTERQEQAEPAPQGGQPYAQDLVRAGDTQCAANQKLRLQSLDLRQLIAANAQRNPDVYDHRSPSYWAPRVKVPVLLSGALQDEQVGPQWTRIIDKLDHNPQVWTRIINGAHFDSLGPQILSQWWDFLNIFVAQRVPQKSVPLEALGTVLYAAITTSPASTVVTDSLSGSPSLAVARQRFENRPRVQVYFDNGAGSAGKGGLNAPWSTALSGWPDNRTTATRLYLGSHGRLQSAPGATATTSYRPDPAARPQGTLDTVGPSTVPWGPTPPYHWEPVKGNTGVGFVTDPLQSAVVVAGTASLDLQLQSSAPVTDLQATISEVRPDGTETYVTSGFLRSSFRATNAAATELDPQRDFLNPTPLQPGFNSVRIAIDPIAYGFRAGSRIRVVLSAPGGDRPSWRFKTLTTNGTVVDTLKLGADGSSLALPVIPGVTPPTPLPAAVGLRGQPARPYVRAGNGG